MKKSNLLKYAVAAAVTLPVAGMSFSASAEVSSSAAVSSMYLWRGQDISSSAPVLSGDISYSHDSGLYAFAWGSSLGAVGGVSNISSYELDLGAGYAGKAGDLGYDLGYYTFSYPEATKADDLDGAEYTVALSYDMVNFKAYIDAYGDNDYSYYTLDASYGAFTGLIGVSDPKADKAGYTHFDLSYAASDKLTFTYSAPLSREANSGLSNKPIIAISYSLPI